MLKNLEMFCNVKPDEPSYPVLRNVTKSFTHPKSFLLFMGGPSRFCSH